VSRALETCLESLAFCSVSFGPEQGSSSEGVSPPGSLVMNIPFQWERPGHPQTERGLLAEWGVGCCRGVLPVLPGPHRPVSPAVCSGHGGAAGALAQRDVGVGSLRCPPRPVTRSLQELHEVQMQNVGSRQWLTGVLTEGCKQILGCHVFVEI